MSYQGIAASLIHGTTIHRFLGMNISGNVGKNKKEELRNKTQYTDVLLIDEYGILTKPFLVQLNNILKDVRKRKEIFGNLKIILLGDNWQISGQNIPMYSINDDVEIIDNQDDNGSSDEENDICVEKMIDRDFDQKNYIKK